MLGYSETELLCWQSSVCTKKICLKHLLLYSGNRTRALPFITVCTFRHLSSNFLGNDQTFCLYMPPFPLFIFVLHGSFCTCFVAATVYRRCQIGLWEILWTCTFPVYNLNLKCEESISRSNDRSQHFMSSIVTISKFEMQQMWRKGPLETRPATLLFFPTLVI